MGFTCGMASQGPESRTWLCVNFRCPARKCEWSNSRWDPGPVWAPRAYGQCPADCDCTERCHPPRQGKARPLASCIVSQSSRHSVALVHLTRCVTQLQERSGLNHCTECPVIRAPVLRRAHRGCPEPGVPERGIQYRRKPLRAGSYLLPIKQALYCATQGQGLAVEKWG